jgi:asparagine synthase (glutamine-hydrolysing)
MVGDLLSTEAVTRRGFFKAAEVQRLCEDHYRGRVDNAYAIWQLLTLELWCKSFLDAPSA